MQTNMKTSDPTNILPTCHHINSRHECSKTPIDHHYGEPNHQFTRVLLWHVRHCCHKNCCLCSLFTRNKPHTKTLTSSVTKSKFGVFWCVPYVMDSCFSFRHRFFHMWTYKSLYPLWRSYDLMELYTKYQSIGPTVNIRRAITIFMILSALAGRINLLVLTKTNREFHN